MQPNASHMPDTLLIPSLKVILIEDSKLLQELLTGTLSELEDVELCCIAESESEALEKMAETQIDLAIIDIQLKEGSGIGILAALQAAPRRFGTPRKVVLTNFAHATMRQRCENLGMDAFFDKSLHIVQLIDYLTAAAEQKKIHFEARESDRNTHPDRDSGTR